MVFSYLLYGAIALLMLPVLILFIQVAAALFSRNVTTNTILSDKERPPVGVIMPAHDEALVIAPSINAIKAQLEPHDQLIVIADNCTDDTASIAEELGAIVIERTNQHERGKGYALDFGLQFLKKNTPEVVLIVDADCIVGEHAISTLAHACVALERPIQSLYLMQAQPNPSLRDRIAAFAWIVKNKVRPLGFACLGLPCQLMGTGMAFLWRDLEKVDLATGHIVEDMKLGVDLARNNSAAIFNTNAIVTSTFPPGEDATETQRSRWEHGHLSVITTELPQLVLEAIKKGNIQMLGLACDLLIPPLAMLTLVCVMVLIASVLLGNALTVILATALVALLALTVLIAWVRFGRDIISFGTLCYAPIYALIKVPLYIKFFLNRQVEWVRSKRD